MYDNIFFNFLSFFLSIGAFTVSAGAYSEIIINDIPHINPAMIYFKYAGCNIKFLLIRTFPKYTIKVPIVHPICVFKWNPPATILYGSIVIYANITSHPIFDIIAIAINNINLGISPIISCKPYLIICALSSFISGIFF